MAEFVELWVYLSSTPLFGLSAKYLFDRLGVGAWAVRGFALGTASHGIGAARATGGPRRRRLRRHRARPAGAARLAADAAGGTLDRGLSGSQSPQMSGERLDTLAGIPTTRRLRSR